MNCPNDDSAACCGCCHFKPTVVIATHERVKITAKNISLLLAQKFRPRVVVVTSDKDEAKYYKKIFPEITLGCIDNNPLGRKWQSGIEEELSDYDPLIILGSDDILHPDYIQRAMYMIQQGYDVVGLTSWYSYDPGKQKIYLTQYTNGNKDFPIGSGKVYSKRILEKMNYQVFDRTLNRKLDDFGYYSAIKHGAKVGLIREPMVLAVKGDWEKLNTIDAYLKSPNIISKEVSLSVLRNFYYE